MLTIINDILDLSKIEAGKLGMEPIQMAVDDFVRATAAAQALVLAGEGSAAHLRIAPELLHRLIGDPGCFRQVLLNLLSNAIKFTDAAR